MMENMDMMGMGFGLISLLMMLIQLFLYGVVIYFLFTAIKYMQQKRKTDQELLEKLDQLLERNNVI